METHGAQFFGHVISNKQSTAGGWKTFQQWKIGVVWPVNLLTLTCQTQSWDNTWITLVFVWLESPRKM